MPCNGPTSAHPDAPCWLLFSLVLGLRFAFALSLLGLWAQKLGKKVFISTISLEKPGEPVTIPREKTKICMSKDEESAVQDGTSENKLTVKQSQLHRRREKSLSVDEVPHSYTLQSTSLSNACFESVGIQLILVCKRGNNEREEKEILSGKGPWLLKQVSDLSCLIHFQELQRLQKGGVKHGALRGLQG